jgi:hypothetical protein
MNRLRIASFVTLVVPVFASVYCREATEPSLTGGAAPAVTSPTYARAVAGPSVTASNPSYGKEGDVSKQVTITGSGFAPDAQAAWERNGVGAPKIAVSTKYVSSTQLVATITIAGDADLGLYDISVTNQSDRKKGIGYSLFEVTTATRIDGTEVAYDVNSNGEITGRVGVPGPFFYSFSNGVATLGAPGRAYAISDDGLTVGGGTTNNALNAQAYVLTNAAGVWQRTNMPKNPASCLAAVRALASNGTGAAVMAGGYENDGCFYQKNFNRKPRIWVLTGSVWVKNILPGIANSDDLLEDVIPSGVAVGSAGGRAAVWTPNGSGVWKLTQIGSTGSVLHAIKRDGTIAAGETNSAAQYWTLSGSAWAGPFNLPGGCTSAVSVDDSGRVLANGCVSGNRRTPAIISPPYDAASVKLLGGFGSGNSVTAEGMSPSGQWVVGESTLQGSQVGVYWRNF